jgi:5-methylthioadenosine/S-adenosylhomocysteine deaminase
MGIHIHLDEGSYEVDYAIEKSGMRPAEYLEAMGFLGPNVHAAHSVLMSDHELDLYQQYDISVAHCPTPVFTYCGVTRIPEMLRRGLRVGLGTDGALSSGGSLDLFRQMNISFVVMVATYGLPYRNPAPILPDDLLRIATVGGARALMWDQEIGSLEVGKKADLILLDRSDLDVLPSYDPVHTVASNASAAQVRTVLVDGKVVVKDGALVNVDEAELKAKVKERAPRILQHFLERIQ